MATITKSVRAKVMERLAVILADAVADDQVLVDVGWVAPEASAEMVLLLNCEQSRGDHGLAALTSDRRGARDDIFDVVLYLETKREGLTALEAAERLEELWNDVEVAVAERKTLALEAGAPTSGLDGVVWAIVRQFDGPDLAATDTGHWARGQGRIEVKTRMN